MGAGDGHFFKLFSKPLVLLQYAELVALAINLQGFISLHSFRPGPGRVQAELSVSHIV